MIFDTLPNASRYLTVHRSLPTAFEYLANFVPSTPDGRYAIDADQVFALVQSYETKTANIRVFEAHQRYIDLQYIVSGEELVYWAPASDMSAQAEVDTAKDLLLFKGDKLPPISSNKLGNGTFGIYFPEDAHMPGCQIAHPGAVKKVVIKIAI